MEDEIKIGDKIKIVCESGHSSNAIIYLGEKAIPCVEKVEIEILPNKPIRAKLNVQSLKIDFEAALSEIRQKNYHADDIKKIIDKLPDMDKWREGKRDKCYEAMDEIINIFYPDGYRPMGDDNGN